MPSSSKPIKLRGHHLICLHFFHGEGYSPEFITNLRELIRRAIAGNEITVQFGPDDVCEMCLYLKGGKCSYGKGADAEIIEMDRTALDLLRIETGSRGQWSDLKKKIPGIFSFWSQTYCGMCDWRNACEKDAYFRTLYDLSGMNRKKLEIDFDEIQKAMEDISRDSFDYYLDRETGEIIPFSEELLQKVQAKLYACDSEEIGDDIEYIEYDEEPEELPEWMEDEVELSLEILLDEEDRYVRVPERSNAAAFESMAKFIGTVEDPVLAEELTAALNGKGAFRRFKNVLVSHPKERKRWHGFNAKEMKKEIIAWLQSIGIEAAS
jgi:uncharacterized protein